MQDEAYVAVCSESLSIDGLPARQDMGTLTCASRLFPVKYTPASLTDASQQ